MLNQTTSYSADNLRVGDLIQVSREAVAKGLSILPDWVVLDNKISGTLEALTTTQIGATLWSFSDGWRFESYFAWKNDDLLSLSFQNQEITSIETPTFNQIAQIAPKDNATYFIELTTVSVNTLLDEYRDVGLFVSDPSNGGAEFLIAVGPPTGQRTNFWGDWLDRVVISLGPDEDVPPVTPVTPGQPEDGDDTSVDAYDNIFFNDEDYLAANPDVAQAVLLGHTTAKDHWINSGIHEGRAVSVSSSEFFDTWNEADYLIAHPDVANAVITGSYKSGFDHYNAIGRLEGRDIYVHEYEAFDRDFYLSNNPDIAIGISEGYIVSPERHFISHGQHEGRDRNIFEATERPSNAALRADQSFVNVSQTMKDLIIEKIPEIGYHKYGVDFTDRYETGPWKFEGLAIAREYDLSKLIFDTLKGSGIPVNTLRNLSSIWDFLNNPVGKAVDLYKEGMDNFEIMSPKEYLEKADEALLILGKEAAGNAVDAIIGRGVRMPISDKNTGVDEEHYVAGVDFYRPNPDIGYLL